MHRLVDSHKLLFTLTFSSCAATDCHSAAALAELAAQLQRCDNDEAHLASESGPYLQVRQVGKVGKVGKLCQICESFCICIGLFGLSRQSIVRSQFLEQQTYNMQRKY